MGVCVWTSVLTDRCLQSQNKQACKHGFNRVWEMNGFHFYLSNRHWQRPHCCCQWKSLRVQSVGLQVDSCIGSSAPSGKDLLQSAQISPLFPTEEVNQPLPCTFNHQLLSLCNQFPEHWESFKRSSWFTRTLQKDFSTAGLLVGRYEMAFCLTWIQCHCWLECSHFVFGQFSFSQVSLSSIQNLPIQLKLDEVT